MIPKHIELQHLVYLNGWLKCWKVVYANNRYQILHQKVRTLSCRDYDGFFVIRT